MNLGEQKELFLQQRKQKLHKSMLRRLAKRPDDIIGTGHGGHYLGTTWCLRAKRGLCFLINKNTYLDSHHYHVLTQLLTEARKMGKLHPIFSPVKTLYDPNRPYLIREEITGRTLDSGDMFDSVFTRSIGTILIQQLKGIDIHPSRVTQPENLHATYDIRCENFIVENIDTRGLCEALLEIEEKDNQHTLLLDLLDNLYTAGGIIWIFDYGTWLRPNRKGEYQ